MQPFSGKIIGINFTLKSIICVCAITPKRQTESIHVDSLNMYSPGTAMKLKKLSDFTRCRLNIF